ncbi:marine proteobacterial sortase target protein [Shewanella donghaensis]|uniref:marine proteobacterial sortase target protein n=1 Tax=Shewanella donghaensis TaxID=238836 RepID=UPI001182B7E2|nr:marine proteobacterial sortase target protein [Shewanella donghaensis]
MNISVNRHTGHYFCSSLILLGLMILNAIFPVYAMPLSEFERRDDGITQGVLEYIQDGEIQHSLPLSTDVSMKVSGWINRVTVKQTFTNNTQGWINGKYHFPLSHNGAVDQMRLLIGDRIIEGEVQPKLQAKATFEKAKAAGKRASLVSQQRVNIFTTEVANLAPKETLTVEISYQEKLNYKDGQFSLRFPMTITPRYSPRSLSESENNEQPQNNTRQTSMFESIAEILPDALTGFNPNDFAEGILTGVDSADYSNNILVNIEVELDTGFDLGELVSPYHKIQSTQLKHQPLWQIKLDTAFVANQDFVLNWKPADSVKSHSANHSEVVLPIPSVFTQQGLTHQINGLNSSQSMTKNQDYYGLVMLTPPQVKDHNTVTPRELILVIDTSGSMQGDSMEQAKQALLSALAGLRTEDKFNIIEFNHQVTKLSTTSLKVNSRNIGKANQFVQKLQANGGTEISMALSASLLMQGDSNQTMADKRADSRTNTRAEVNSYIASAANYLRQVIFITDGAVSNEQGLFKQIEADLGQSRLFTVGIGSAPNAHFMERAAMFGRGTYTYIGKTAEVKQKIDRLLQKIEQPVATDVKVTYQDGTVPDYWPAKIPDLYNEEPILVSFKSPSYNQQDIVISGVTHGEHWQLQLRQPQQASNMTDADVTRAGLDLLWANAQINAIEATQTRANSERIKQQVEALGMKYHLVTSQTSLVAVDKTPVNFTPEFNSDSQVKPHLPKGFKQSGVLPQTATSSRLDILIGLSFLLIALMHGLWLKQCLPGQRLILPQNK